MLSVVSVGQVGPPFVGIAERKRNTFMQLYKVYSHRRVASAMSRVASPSPIADKAKTAIGESRDGGKQEWHDAQHGRGMIPLV